MSIAKQYYPGYDDALYIAAHQSTEDDLAVLDTLFGRENLPANATPRDIKAEVFRQLAEEWTTQEWRRAHAEANLDAEEESKRSDWYAEYEAELAERARCNRVGSLS
ncbi:MAG: hypothetical protein DYG90_04665 [Chloroflexi bacterium CFX6]|nr:hypothetical protein [Chloroflexi bacterium CFX6]